MNQSINTDSKHSKEPQQKYRLGTVSIKILGGLNRFYGRPTSPSASVMAQNTCEEFTRILYTCKKFARILYRRDQYVRIFHKTKIRYLLKIRTYLNLKIGRTYMSDMPKCDVFARVTNTKCKKQGSTKPASNVEKFSTFRQLPVSPSVAPVVG